MYVHLPNATVFDMGLTGQEMQESFDLDKYIALAYSSAKGVQLANLVEQNWDQWLKIVDEASWTRSWHRSHLFNKPAGTPMGSKFYSNKLFAAVALAIYTSAVWGFGIEQWVPGQVNALKTNWTPSELASVDKRLSQQARNPTIKTMNRLKHCRPIYSGTVWDQKLLRGCGVLLPPEFGDLDRWLQPLWLTIV